MIKKGWIRSLAGVWYNMMKVDSICAAEQAIWMYIEDTGFVIKTFRSNVQAQAYLDKMMEGMDGMDKM